jgi:hypothetical protein
MKKTIVSALILPLMLLLLTGCQKTISTNDAQRNPELKKNDNGTIWVMNVQLSGLNEVPPNDLGATGNALLRVTADKVLHSKVNVDAPPEAGTLVAAHIHAGAAGVNGPVKIFLCHNTSEFGVNQELQLTDEQYNMLMNDHLYVNAHSTVKPGGLLRGQIR